MQQKQLRHLLEFLAVLGLIFVVLGLYWHGAVVQLQKVNTNLTRTDQSAYMSYTRQMYDSDYTFIGGRNRMPTYPFLQSLFYRQGMSDEDFFTRGKYLNLILSIGLLTGLAFLFRRFLDWLSSFNLVLIVAFTVFMFKASFFQSELLFYFLNFCLFLLMWHLLQEASWRLAILTGVIAGLAHLTKASILPGLLVFFICAAVRWVWDVVEGRRSPSGMVPSSLLHSRLFSILLVGGFFLLTVFPYIDNSKQVFGHYFYNVNSTFYLWYDSWEEVKHGTRAHGDRVGWPKMAPEDIPSLSKYVREHTAQEIVDRFADGGRKLLRNVTNSYGYFKYIVLYACLLIITVFRYRRRASEAIKSNLVLSLFLLFYFSGYFLLYSWYAPIASGNRLILAQFIPLIFTLAYYIQGLLNSSQTRVAGRTLNTSTLINLAILLIVTSDISFILMEHVGTMYGGN